MINKNSLELGKNLNDELGYQIKLLDTVEKDVK